MQEIAFNRGYIPVKQRVNELFSLLDLYQRERLKKHPTKHLEGEEKWKVVLDNKPYYVMTA